MNLVSVIIPIYNQAKVLRRSLLSLARQTYRPLEVIIVNDGSTDDFEAVLNDVLSDNRLQELNIKVIHQSNQGAPSARNHGFSESNGDYIIFWDADTIAKPQMLSEMVKVLDNNLTASWVYSQFRFGWKKMSCADFNFDHLKKINYIDITSLLRRNAFQPFDEKLKRFQDWDLWLTLSEQGKNGIFIPKILYKKITNPTGISSWFPSLFFKLPWKIKKVEKYQEAAEIIKRKHDLS